MATPVFPLGLRLLAAVLALVGAAMAVWPVRLNQATQHGILERWLWADPGAITAWVVRLFAIYWTAVWGWGAVFGRFPPFFPK